MPFDAAEFNPTAQQATFFVRVSSCNVSKFAIEADVTGTCRWQHISNTRVYASLGVWVQHTHQMIQQPQQATVLQALDVTKIEYFPRI